MLPKPHRIISSRFTQIRATPLPKEAQCLHSAPLFPQQYSMLPASAYRIRPHSAYKRQTLDRALLCQPLRRMEAPGLTVKPDRATLKSLVLICTTFGNWSSGLPNKRCGVAGSSPSSCLGCCCLLRSVVARCDYLLAGCRREGLRTLVESFEICSHVRDPLTRLRPASPPHSYLYPASDPLRSLGVWYEACAGV